MGCHCYFMNTMNRSGVLATLVGKLINACDAQRVEVISGVADILVSVVVGYVGHAHDDAVGQRRRERDR